MFFLVASKFEKADSSANPPREKDGEWVGYSPNFEDREKWHIAKLSEQTVLNADIDRLLSEDRYTEPDNHAEVMKLLAADYLGMKGLVVRTTEVVRAMKLKAVMMEEALGVCEKLILSGRDLVMDSFLFQAQADSLMRYIFPIKL